MLTSVVCSFDDKELVKSFVGIIRLSKVMSNLILPSFIWNLIIICTFFKKVKNNHGGVLLLAKLHAETFSTAILKKTCALIIFSVAFKLVLNKN